MDKKSFRKATLSRRAEIYNADIDATVVDRFLASDYYKNAQTMMLYVSFGTEINTHGLVKRALADGKTVAVPICNMKDHTITLSKITDFEEDLTEGSYGILEVKPERLNVISPEALDLVLVPGMAFGENGTRMGFGGGYYDRFLETIRPDAVTIALIREAFVCNEIPLEPHDKCVDVLITEDRIHRCKPSKGE